MRFTLPEFQEEKCLLEQLEKYLNSIDFHQYLLYRAKKFVLSYNIRQLQAVQCRYSHSCSPKMQFQKLFEEVFARAQWAFSIEVLPDHREVHTVSFRVAELARV